MKRWTIFFATGYILLNLLSCNRDVNVLQFDDAGAGFDTNFLADIEGIPLNADAITVSQTTIMGSSIIRISARNTSTNQLLTIQFPSTLPVGAYQYDLMPSTTLAFGSYQPDTSSPEIFTSTSGVLCILDTDVNEGFVEGTTFFTAAVTSVGSVIEITFCEFALAY